MTSRELIYELQALRKSLAIINSPVLDEYLNKVVRTDRRKKIWIYIDGVNSTSELNQRTGISQKSIIDFLDYAKEIGIVYYEKRKPPKRYIDYIPADWIKELGKDETEESTNEKISEDRS